MPSRKDKMSAYIDKHSEKRGGCGICNNDKLRAEIEMFEDLLREKKQRMPISGVWQYLNDEKLVPFQCGQFSKHLQRPCHKKFYDYLKGLE